MWGQQVKDPSLKKRKAAEENKNFKHLGPGMSLLGLQRSQHKRLKPQKFIFPQFWRLEVLVQGIGSLGSSEASLLGLRTAALLPALHNPSSLKHVPLVSPTLYKDMRGTGLGLSHVTSV